MITAERARRAVRRGDLQAAERWFKLAERAAAMAARLAAMRRAEAAAEAERSPQYNPPARLRS